MVVLRSSSSLSAGEVDPEDCDGGGVKICTLSAIIPASDEHSVSELDAIWARKAKPKEFKHGKKILISPRTSFAAKAGLKSSHFLTAMHLMYTLDASGNRIYSLKVRYNIVYLY